MTPPLMHTHEYFFRTYRNRATTVMHRMRTWYNQQARLADREKRYADANRFQAMANGMTSNINEAKGF